MVTVLMLLGSINQIQADSLHDANRYGAKTLFNNVSASIILSDLISPLTLNSSDRLKCHTLTR